MGLPLLAVMSGGIRTVFYQGTFARRSLPCFTGTTWILKVDRLRLKPVSMVWASLDSNLFLEVGWLTMHKENASRHVILHCHSCKICIVFDIAGPEHWTGAIYSYSRPSQYRASQYRLPPNTAAHFQVPNRLFKCYICDSQHPSFFASCSLKNGGIEGFDCTYLF